MDGAAGSATAGRCVSHTRRRIGCRWWTRRGRGARRPERDTRNAAGPLNWLPCDRPCFLLYGWPVIGPHSNPGYEGNCLASVGSQSPPPSSGGRTCASTLGYPCVRGVHPPVCVRGCADRTRSGHAPTGAVCASRGLPCLRRFEPQGCVPLRPVARPRVPWICTACQCVGTPACRGLGRVKGKVGGPIGSVLARDSGRRCGCCAYG